MLDDLCRGHAKRSRRARACSRSTCSTRAARATRSPRASTASCTSPRSRWSPSRSRTRSATTGATSSATLNLLDAMRERRRRAPRVLLHLRGLRRAGRRSRCPRTMPTDPVNAYGASKLAVDRMIADECRAHGLGAVSLRYFNVAGASGDARRGPRARDAPDPARAAGRRRARDHVKVFGTDYPTRDGTAVRDYIHVEDLARAHLLALERAPAGRAPHLQPRQRRRLLGREVIEAARASPGTRSPRTRSRAGPAIPPRSWPPATRSATSSAGSREEEPRDMVADAWAWHRGAPGRLRRTNGWIAGAAAVDVRRRPFVHVSNLGRNPLGIGR